MATSLDTKLVSLLRKMSIVPEKLRQRRASGPGAHLSKGLGQSMDFSEYRPYQPGDDLRALDWKVYGRTDRLYTKLYVPEQEETVCLLLDTSGSMAVKWPTLVTLVLALVTVALGQGDRICLSPLANPEVKDKRGIAPCRGRGNLARVASFLQHCQPTGVTELSSAFEEQARVLKSRCHVIVISDFLQPDAGLPGLSQLRYRRHRMTVLQLLSPDESDPRQALAPGEWELFDPEPSDEATSVRLDLGPESFSRYEACLRSHNQKLESFCRKSGAVFVSARSDLDPLSFFSETLRKAGLLS